MKEPDNKTRARLEELANRIALRIPTDERDKFSSTDLRRAVVESPELFPFVNPDLERLAEDAERVGKNLDDAKIPRTEGNNGLSLWGRVQVFAGKRFVDEVSVEDGQLDNFERAFATGTSGCCRAEGC